MIRLIIVICVTLSFIMNGYAIESRLSTSLLIDIKNGKEVFILENKLINKKNLLNKAGEFAPNYKDISLFSVIAHEDVKISTLTYVRDCLQKNGFLKIQYYHFDNDKKMMEQIKLEGGVVPFNLHPNDSFEK